MLAPQGAPCVFGRGTSTPDDPHPRALLARQRPHRTTPGPPLELPSLSRVQLIVRASAGSVRVRSPGRLPMAVNGETCTEARLEPGDTLSLGDVLLFVCDLRPDGATGAIPGPAHPFGEPDAHGIIGETPAAWALRRALAFHAGRDLHTLVFGESGTGKELAARALHAMSPRGRGPWVARNAATLPEGLVDAELFGNTANYPNPGMPSRPGLVGTADGGSLFLDEIGELPVSVQAHLLRLLDRGDYQRLGDARNLRADLRVIGATNRAPEALKEDVLARFPLQLTVPSLDVRRADIPLLVRHLLRAVAARDPDLAERFFDEGEPRVTVGFVAELLTRPWPTNVRGLLGALWRAMGEQDRGTLDVGAPPAAGERWDLSLAPEDLPAAHIQACLDAHNGVQEEVWRALGLASRFVLRRLIARHGLVVRKALRR
ncbi:MAG: sigma 54-interacting transcriptional regulator [Myxococcota bacterium]